MKNDSGPQELNLILILDRDWKRTIKVYNLTKSNGTVTRSAFNYEGYTAKMEVKKRPGAPTALLTLNTTDYSLILSSGQIDIFLDRETINANITCGTYYYDIAITDSAGSYDHIFGRVEVKDNVTDID